MISEMHRLFFSYNSEYYGFIFAAVFVFSIVILSLSIVSMRKKHHTHVYTLWYLFSLAFCVAIILLFCSSSIVFSPQPQDNFITKSAALFIDMSTDLSGELYLIGILVALAVGPQVITYAISGLFGCGTPPIYMATITNWTVMGLGKFYATMAGVVTAQGVYHYFHADQALTMVSMLLLGLPLQYKDLLVNALLALILMMAAFATSAIYYYFGEVLRNVSVPHRLRWLLSVFQYMSKYKDNYGKPDMES